MLFAQVPSWVAVCMKLVCDMKHQLACAFGSLALQRTRFLSITIAKSTLTHCHCACADTHELLAIDTSALPRMSNAYLEFVGDTSDVDNSRDSSNVVAFYKPKTGLWFGHTAMPYSADGAVR